MFGSGRFKRTVNKITKRGSNRLRHALCVVMAKSLSHRPPYFRWSIL
ncbi:transposase [Bacillus sp. EB600]